MLTVTDNAADQIRTLTDLPDALEGGGLRIATDSEAGSLLLSLAGSPVEGDEVLDTAGARLFLDPEAALILDDKELDASVDGAGRVQFAVAEQAG
jgi:iron-sulfur cluster assembly protein